MVLNPFLDELVYMCPSVPLCAILCTHMWLYVVICVYMWLCVILCGYVCTFPLSFAMGGWLGGRIPASVGMWLYVVICGYMWLYVVICGYVWLYVHFPSFLCHGWLVRW